MALPPQTSDAFLREVEEEVRRDKAVAFGRRWGGAIVVAVVLALVALAVGLWWQQRREAQAESAAEAETTLLADLGRGQKTGAPAALATMDRAPGRGYSAAASLLRADIALTDGNTSGAVPAYQKIADDAHLPQPVRNAALIRLVSAQFDTAPPATTIARLRPLTAPGSPWFGSAGEMTAISYLKLGNAKQAGALLAAIAQDGTVPASIRARTLQLASSLGVDSSALAGAVR